MNDFNLISHPWVPVHWQDGRHALVGLDELFRNAAHIADLDVVPHERISLIRLLVCITQAALGAPDDPSGWEGFGANLEETVPSYLARADILPHFNLFGEGPRFLQRSKLEGTEPELTSWIVFRLATGNNGTQFDHFGGTERALPPEEIAKAMLAWQNFSPPVGKHTGDGPCSKNNALHCLIQGKSLSRTILLNCLDSESISANWSGGVGRPVWEVIHSGGSIESATTTYLGRLVPVHRPLWLIDSTWLRKGRDGVKYPSFAESQIREPSVALRNLRDGVAIKGMWDTERAIWRDLEAIGADRQFAMGTQTQMCPLIIQSHLFELDEEAVLPVWLGAVVFENTASLVKTVESTFDLPSEFFTEIGRTVYSKGIAWAETSMSSLKLASKHYEREMRGMSQKAPKNGFPVHVAAQRHYWHSLDLQRQLLLDLVRDSSPLGSKNFGEGDDPWSAAVRKAVFAAYDHACPRTTPRQIQAYALGLRRLRPKSSKPKTAKITP